MIVYFLCSFDLASSILVASMLPLHVFIALLLLSLHAAPYSAADDTLTAGQVLAVGEKLVSRNGKFALGFFQPSAVAISKSSYYTNALGCYLAIWFNKIPIFTTVWVANRERAITGPQRKSTQLRLSGDCRLFILDGATKSIIWSTHVVNRTETSMNASAILLNSGNLVVQSPSGVVLWQSFDYPTDVVLPGAKFGWNKATGLNRLGISKKSLIDPGLGSYSVELDTVGARGLILKHRNPSIEYWSSDKALIIPILKSLFEMDPRTRGLITPAYVDNSEEEFYIYTTSDESSSVFVSLDVTGQIKMYVWSQANQSWQSIYAQPVDPCTPSATCGPFTICNGNSSQICDCMESFSQKSPWNWELDDRTGGCIRNTPLHCVDDKNMTSSTDMFQPIGLVTLPYDPQIMQDATTQGECAQACLSNCSCTAYSYQNSRCSVWHGELLNVNKNDGIYINADNVLHLRLAATDFQDLRKNKRKPNVALVAGSSVVSFGLALLMILLMITRNKFKCCGAPFHDSEGRGGTIAFRYTDLAHATKNFSDKLGAGGFGSVFKGVLSDLTTVAVKKLAGARQGEKQFRAEVSSVGIIQHINLVKLIGYCCEGDKRLLVYEHMLNGSLDVHLFQSHATVLNWITRHQIAIGVARGLSYLHESCRECIIHCDIKPENILLDISFSPKIADFGMATFVGRDFSRVLTTFRGTVGYLAPEWISGVAITPKVDVYSFGMVLFEIISGRRNSPEVHTSGNYAATYFPMRAINKLHEGDMSSLVDPRLHGDFNLEEVVKVCKVACWCIQDNELDRPTMREVVRVLEGLQELDMPPMPRLLATLTNFSAVASM